MNFLAHAYLSFNKTDLLVGNMISDFVKGKMKFDYSIEVQKGIALHRAIDCYTDNHPITKEAKVYLKESAGLYSGAFIDIVYDHFLATDPNCFSNESLEVFCTGTYATLQQYKGLLPPRFIEMLPFMISQNWLYNYKDLWGTQRSFEGLVRRAKFISDSTTTFKAFTLHYSSLQNCYNQFFPQLRAFAKDYVQSL